MRIVKRTISEQAPVLVFSFLNFYAALVISIAIPLSELLVGKEKSKIFVILKIPVLILLSVVASQAYGRIELFEVSTRDLIGTLVIIFWVHLYLIQRLRKD